MDIHDSVEEELKQGKSLIFKALDKFFPFRSPAYWHGDERKRRVEAEIRRAKPKPRVTPDERITRELVEYLNDITNVVPADAPPVIQLDFTNATPKDNHVITDCSAALIVLGALEGVSILPGTVHPNPHRYWVTTDDIEVGGQAIETLLDSLTNPMPCDTGSHDINVMGHLDKETAPITINMTRIRPDTAQYGITTLTLTDAKSGKMYSRAVFLEYATPRRRDDGLYLKVQVHAQNGGEAPLTKPIRPDGVLMKNITDYIRAVTILSDADLDPFPNRSPDLLPARVSIQEVTNYPRGTIIAAATRRRGVRRLKRLKNRPFFGPVKEIVDELTDKENRQPTTLLQPVQIKQAIKTTTGRRRAAKMTATKKHRQAQKVDKMVYLGLFGNFGMFKKDIGRYLSACRPTSKVSCSMYAQAQASPPGSATKIIRDLPTYNRHGSPGAMTVVLRSQMRNDQLVVMGSARSWAPGKNPVRSQLVIFKHQNMVIKIVPCARTKRH